MLGFARKLAKKAEGIIAPEIQPTHAAYGFRVLRVEPDSEAARAGLEPLFDYIVAVNGARFDEQVTTYDSGASSSGTSGLAGVAAEHSPHERFTAEIAQTRERLVLDVWSAKGRTQRLVVLPNPAKQARGLGATVRWTSTAAADNVWHILNVVPGSPADRAHLVSHADYIVGAENGALETQEGEQLLARVIGRASPADGVLFYVYNRDYDVLRPVRVFPTPDGKLGCGVGFGLLHALPKVASGQSAHAPGSLLFDARPDTALAGLTEEAGDEAGDYAGDQAGDHASDVVGGEGEVLVARAPTFAPPPAAAAAPTAQVYASHAKHHARPAPALALDDYFEEQSKLSRARDTPARSVAAVPPPPKAQ